MTGKNFIHAFTAFWLSTSLLQSATIPAAPSAVTTEKSDKSNVRGKGVDSQVGEPRKQFRYKGNGYLYFDTGACKHGYAIVGVGGGGEGFIWRGLTLGGDLSYNHFVDDAPFILGSLRFGYHFVDRSVPKKIDPFVNFSLGTIGGGAYYWFREKIGLRSEVRYFWLPCDSLILFRIGIGFR